MLFKLESGLRRELYCINCISNLCDALGCSLSETDICAIPMENFLEQFEAVSSCRPLLDYLSEFVHILPIDSRESS